MEVYGASLCPDSRRFIALLDGLLASGSLGEDQVQVASTASGRVRNATGGSGQWDLQCQHGPEECYFNRWWGCGVERHPNQTVW